METWKDIEGFDGYQISDKGRVRTHNKITSNKRYETRRWKDRIIKQKVSKLDGRARVILWENGREHTILVHRLQAITFLGKPEDPKMTVNHKDGNPLNNVVENLEWLSRADNIRHGFEHGLYPTQKPIVIVDGNNEVYAFRSLSECGRFLGKSSGYVSDVVLHKRLLKDSNGGVYQYL